jgi:hypothetical protein
MLMNYSTWNVQGIRGKTEEITSELGKLKIDVIDPNTQTKCKMFGLLHFRVYLRVTRNSRDINKTSPVPVKVVSDI